MTLPALIADFPPRSNTAAYNERAALLGRQWPICWTVGNNLFRPISTISTLAYAFQAYSYSRPGDASGRSWKLFAAAAVLHLSVIIHSAVNMQPLNDKLAALAGVSTDGKSRVVSVAGDAVGIATKWIRLNLYRAVVPFFGGAVGLWSVLA